MLLSGTVGVELSGTEGVVGTLGVEGSEGLLSGTLGVVDSEGLLYTLLSEGLLCSLLSEGLEEVLSSLPLLSSLLS